MTLMPVSKISTLTLWSVNVGGVAVDRRRALGVDRAAAVDRLADDVEDAAEALRADRHRDRAAGVLHVHAADEAFGRVHRDRAHRAFAEVLRDLEREVVGLVADLRVA